MRSGRKVKRETSVVVKTERGKRVEKVERRWSGSSSSVLSDLSDVGESEGEDDDPGPRTGTAKTTIQKTTVERPQTRAREDDGATAAVPTGPAGWETQYRLAVEMREKMPAAAVDTMGCAQLADRSAPRPVQRFQTLVALMLSSQTRDEITSAAIERLKSNLPGGLTVGSILESSAETIDRLIHPVGFHNTKTRNLIAVANLLRTEYNDDIPPTVDSLTGLPGVGPKMAILCAGAEAGWDDPQAGIGVDVHVHRIANRLGWVGSPDGPTKTPEQTRKQLQAWLPVHLWRPINPLLVGFGQLVCGSKPKCDLCDLAKANVCPSSLEPKCKTVKRKRRSEPGDDTSVIQELGDDVPQDDRPDGGPAVKSKYFADQPSPPPSARPSRLRRVRLTNKLKLERGTDNQVDIEDMFLNR